LKILYFITILSLVARGGSSRKFLGREEGLALGRCRLSSAIENTTVQQLKDKLHRWI